MNITVVNNIRQVCFLQCYARMQEQQQGPEEFGIYCTPESCQCIKTCILNFVMDKIVVYKYKLFVRFMNPCKHFVPPNKHYIRLLNGVLVFLLAERQYKSHILSPHSSYLGGQRNIKHFKLWDYINTTWHKFDLALQQATNEAVRRVTDCL